MNALVVVPTYNERDNLPMLVRGVLAHDGFRLLVVDDGSPDGTGADRRCARAASIPGRVEVMHRTGNAASAAPTSTACATRSRTTDADLICQMDADLSHDPEYLPALTAAAGRRTTSSSARAI